VVNLRNLPALRSVSGVGILLVMTSVVHLPGGIFHWAFDRNALPQFILLVVLAATCGISLIWKFNKIRLPGFMSVTLALLIISASISLALSKSVITGLTGDAGRFTGLVSLICLLIIAIWAGQQDLEKWKRFYNYILVGVLAVDILGFGQSLHLYALPGDGGVGSTLGNLDFLSAWMGTTTILFFAIRSANKWIELSKYLLVAVVLFTIFRIGAKQGVLDFIFLLPFLAAYRLRARLKNLPTSQGFWSAIISVLLIMWCEVIYLTPMANLQVPGIAGDVNVNIRADFWFSGVSMFFKNIFFGVGPDNYGYFYEQFRSANSVRTMESVITNDAHSAMVQSFATLGLVSVLIFLALIVYLVRCFVRLIVEDAANRRFHAFLAVFSFIYLTNSLISPITLPHKVIFWAISGYVIGRGALRSAGEFTMAKKVIAGALVAVIVVTGVSTGYAFTRLNLADDALHENSKVSYTFSPFLPCVLYFPKQLDLTVKAGRDAIKVAEQQVKANPRCLDAQLYLANIYLANKEITKARAPIYALLEIAPARREIARLAAIYAIQAKDKALQKRVAAVGLRLFFDKKTGKIVIN
jgi:hypothetical protein